MKQTVMTMKNRGLGPPASEENAAKLVDQFLTHALSNVECPKGKRRCMAKDQPGPCSDVWKWRLQAPPGSTVVPGDVWPALNDEFMEEFGNGSKGIFFMAEGGGDAATSLQGFITLEYEMPMGGRRGFHSLFALAMGNPECKASREDDPDCTDLASVYIYSEYDPDCTDPAKLWWDDVPALPRAMHLCAEPAASTTASDIEKCMLAEPGVTGVVKKKVVVAADLCDNEGPPLSMRQSTPPSTPPATPAPSWW